MDRRSFVKLLATAIAVPSLVGLPEKQVFPVKWKYKGFDIIVSDRPEMWYYKQVFASKGKRCAAILLDGTGEENECAVKQWLNGVDKRWKRCA